MTTRPDDATRVRAGTPAFRRLNAALFAAAMATFALLYATQPLLPLIDVEFGASPALGSLALVSSTAVLGVAMLGSGAVGHRFGRVRVMRISLVAASALGVLSALSPDLWSLVGLRALLGLALAGLPALLVGHLADEVHGDDLGRAVGIYIAGNALGGMSGRLLSGAVADVGGWRWGVASVGVLAVVCAVAFVLLLPRAAGATPLGVAAPMAAPAPGRADSAPAPGGADSDPAHVVADHAPAAAPVGSGAAMSSTPMVLLFVVGGLLMGAFISVYNGLGYRLAAPPYLLGTAAAAAVFAVYPLGAVSSALCGRWSDRLGRRQVALAALAVALVGTALTASSALALIWAGVALVTIGFFGAHSVASGWVGRLAGPRASQGSARYLLGYYSGSSLMAPLAGALWEGSGWPGVMALAAGLLLAAVACVLVIDARTRTPRP